MSSTTQIADAFVRYLIGDREHAARQLTQMQAKVETCPGTNSAKEYNTLWATLHRQFTDIIDEVQP